MSRRRILWVFFVIQIVFSISQPLKSEDQFHNEREKREDFVRCCPCPDDVIAARSGANGLDSVAETSRSVGVLVPSRLAVMDNCPCRGRDADSATGASLLIPVPVSNPGISLISNEENKEDGTLFQPEVNLASSVIETLREVTDEEYENALQREAARNAARAQVSDMDSDATPEASDIMVDITNPDSNENSLPNNPQKTECAETKASAVNTVEKQSQGNILNLNEKNEISDSSESSNPVKLSDRLRPPFAKLLPEDLLFISKSKLASKDKLNKSKLNDSNKDSNSGLRSKLDDFRNRIKEKGSIFSPKISNIGTEMKDAHQISDAEVDIDPAASNAHQKMADSLLSPLLPELLKPSNIFSLNDVENMKRDDESNNLNNNSLPPLPELKLPTITELLDRINSNSLDALKIPTLMDIFQTTENPKKSTTNSLDTNISSGSKKQEINTELTDVLPGASENQQSVITAENVEENQEISSSIENTEVNNDNDFGSEIIENLDSDLHSENQLNDIPNGEFEHSDETVQSDQNRQAEGRPENNNYSKLKSLKVLKASTNNNWLHKRPHAREKLKTGLFKSTKKEFRNEELTDPNCLVKGALESEQFDIEPKDSNVALMDNRPVTTQDLQTLSDSLLDESQRSHNTLPSENNSQTSSEEIDLQNDELSSKESNVQASDVIKRTKSRKSDEANCSTDMSSAASEAIGTKKTISSKLRQNLVVQPLFSNNDQQDFLSPNLNILSLDELRKRLTNLFGNGNVLGRQSSNSGNTEKVISDASSNSKAFIPSRDTEVNLNLFRMNPPNLGHNLPATLQSLRNGLNVQSLKTRLRLADLDNIKPIRFQTSFGKDNSILGATLNLSPIKHGALNRPLLSPLWSKEKELNLPTLEDLRSTIEDHAQNLLGVASLGTPQIGNLQNVRDSLKANTATALNSLQQSVASTLDEAKMRSSNLLGESIYAKPETENILHTLARAQSDASDKLQMLHSSLASHYSSLQERLASPFNGRFLGIPMLGQRVNTGKSRVLSKPSVKTSSRTNNAMNEPRKSTRLRKTKPLYRSSENVQKTPVPSTNSRSVAKIGMPHMRTHSDEHRNSFPSSNKITVAPISPAPEIKRRPINVITSEQRLREFQPQQGLSRNNSPSRLNAPRLLAMPTSDHTSGLFNKERLQIKTPIGLFSRDHDGSPSEPIVTKTLPDISAKTRNSHSRLASLLKPSTKINIAKMDLPEPLRSILPESEDIDASNDITSSAESFASSEDFAGRKSTTEVDFLKKIKESVKNRYAIKSKEKDAKLGNTEIDMSEGASEIQAKVSREPLKENVSYKCRLVCSKE